MLFGDARATDRRQECTPQEHVFVVTKFYKPIICIYKS